MDNNLRKSIFVEWKILVSVWISDILSEDVVPWISDTVFFLTDEAKFLSKNVLKTWHFVKFISDDVIRTSISESVKGKSCGEKDINCSEMHMIKLDH